MQICVLFLTVLIGFAFLLNNFVHGDEINFPVEVCGSGLVSGNSWPCVTQLANVIFRLHNWSEDTSINICGMNCRGNLKGRISKWKWDERFRCDSIALGIIGQDTKQSRMGY